jgi:hypothetical protein
MTIKKQVPGITYAGVKRIGASECLERDRGPVGPPSEMKWSVFAKQIKKRFS